MGLPDSQLTGILAHLDTASLARAACCCRRAAGVVAREDLLLWAPRCAEHGVHSLDGWGFSTFRELYVGLLHRYGPLRGVWLGRVDPLGGSPGVTRWCWRQRITPNAVCRVDKATHFVKCPTTGLHAAAGQRRCGARQGGGRGVATELALCVLPPPSPACL